MHIFTEKKRKFKEMVRHKSLYTISTKGDKF